MIEVTQEQFFEALKADKRDIMPSQASPLYTEWLSPSREGFGRTYPGWKEPGEQKRYLLQESR